MNKHNLFLSSFLVLYMLLAPHITAAEAGLAGYWSFDDVPVCNPEPNLVLNPSFENGMNDWQGTCPEGVLCSVDSTSSSEGTSSFKVQFTGTNVNFYQIYQEINIEPDTYYELRYWLKTEDTTHLTRLEYLLYNGSTPIECEGSFCYAFGVGGYSAGTHGWREFVTYFRTTHDTTKIKIRPRKYSDGSPTYGTAWWDNITLQKIGSITVPDDSGNGNEGELYEAVCTEGKSGKAFRFDGSNDRIYIPDSKSLNITGRITVDMWVRGYSSEQERKSVYLLGKEYAYIMQAGRKGATSFVPDLAFKVMNSDNDTWYSEETLEDVLDGAWHNLVGVFDGSKIQVFVDDKYKGERRVTNLYSPYWFNNDTIFGSGRPLFIGSYKNSTGAFKGVIDEVKIYNRTTHYFGYNNYTLYPGDKVYINDYSNYHLDNFVFTLLSTGKSVTIEQKSGTETKQYTLNQGDVLRVKNTEIRLIQSSDKTALLSFSPVVFPTPKYINITGEGFTLNENTKIVIGNDSGSFENAQILQKHIYDNYGLLLEIVNASKTSQQENIILIGSRSDNTLLNEKIREIGDLQMPVGKDGFVLFSNRDVVIAESNSETGGFYAINTLVSLLEKGHGNVLGLEINDYPTIRGMRSFHFPTVSDKRIDTEFIKSYIKKLSELRFNTLFLLIDGGGDGGMQVRLESHPEASKPDAISKEEMRDIISYAKSLHIEVIPQINTVSKAHMLIGKSHPELMLNNYTLDFSKPSAYDLVLDIANEVVDIFNSTYLHIGNDELYGYVGDSVGTNDPIMTPEQFAEAITRVHDNISSRGIKIIMWGDMLLNPDDFPNEGCHGGYNEIYKTIDSIPNDMIIADWHYKYWRSKNFPSVDYFQSKGFGVIGSVWDSRDTDNYFSQYIALRQNISQTHGMMGTIWFPFNMGDRYTVDTVIEESAEAFWSSGTALNLCTDNDHDQFYFEAGGCDNMEGFLGHNDCNDSNSAVNPGASEICGNGIDDNCDGYDLSCSPSSADANHNGCIETSELVSFINLWLSSGDVSIQELVEVIMFWKSGNGCI